MKQRSALMTPANIVTLVRIFLIPVFVFVLLAPWPSWFPFWPEAIVLKPWISAVVYALLAATDGVDGYLARSRNEVTTLGKFLDPIADKILVCAALLALCELGTLPSWIALVILAREFIVSGLRMVVSVEGVVIAASPYGKMKTVVTIIAIIMFIVKDAPSIALFGPSVAHWIDIASWSVMIIAVVLTIVSMIDYFAKANDVLHLFESKGGKKDLGDSIE
jgi:nicotinamide-nucleotide amidase